MSVFLLGSFPATDSAAVTAARLMLGRLRGAAPAAHDWLAAYVTARTALGPVLDAAAGRTRPGRSPAPVTADGPPDHRPAARRRR